MIHLAKSASAAILTTWCGFDQVRTRNEMSPAFCRWDQGPINRQPPFDCEHCLSRIVQEIARLRALVPGTFPALEKARDATNGLGCGDNSCPLGRRGGVGTNGGCRCEDVRKLRRDAGAWASYAKMLEGVTP